MSPKIRSGALILTGFLQNTSAGFAGLSTTFRGVFSMTFHDLVRRACTSTSFFLTVSTLSLLRNTIQIITSFLHLTYLPFLFL